MERVRNCFPVETSTKQTGCGWGWPSDFINFLSLAGFIARVGLADYINATASPHYLAVGMPPLERL